MAKQTGNYSGNRPSNTEVTFEIQKHLTDLEAANSRGWKREVNLVSWNGAEPKVDIRAWSADHSRMGKGITLTTEEFTQLQRLNLTPQFEQQENLQKETPNLQEDFEPML
jgi:hypothetical protein